MFTYGVSTVYSSYGEAKKRLEMKMEEAIEQAIKVPIGKNKKYLKLSVCANEKDGVDCVFPDIRYQLF